MTRVILRIIGFSALLILAVSAFHNCACSSIQDYLQLLFPLLIGSLVIWLVTGPRDPYQNQ